MKRFLLPLVLVLSLAGPSLATTLFIETPDATRDTKFWASVSGTVAYDSTTPTKSGIASWKFGDAASSSANQVRAPVTSLTGRQQGWLRVADLPTAGTHQIMGLYYGAAASAVFVIRINSSGLLQLVTGTGVQIGLDGATLSTAVLYRVTLLWNITNTTTYSVKVLLDGVETISASNSPTLDSASPIEIIWAYIFPEANKFLNWAHAYADDVGDLTDPGDIRVTAKRPNANGTTNGFTTQIGAGGSGYGSGHSPQVNEQPLSVTNGWSMIGAGAAVTEEYNIEAPSVGDVNISAAALVDLVGWVYAASSGSQTAQIILKGSNSNIALTTTNTMFTKVAGSSVYPPGSGTDIGIITSTDLQTVSLYEAGIMAAYKPGRSLVYRPRHFDHMVVR